MDAVLLSTPTAQRFILAVNMVLDDHRSMAGYAEMNCVLSLER